MQLSPHNNLALFNVTRISPPPPAIALQHTSTSYCSSYSCQQSPIPPTPSSYCPLRQKPLRSMKSSPRQIPIRSRQQPSVHLHGIPLHSIVIIVHCINLHTASRQSSYPLRSKTLSAPLRSKNISTP